MASYNLSESTIFLVCPNENVTNTCVFKETAHRVSFLHVYKCGFINWCYKVDRWMVCWRVPTPPPNPRKVVYFLRDWCANCHTVTLTLQNNFRIAQYLWTTTVYLVQLLLLFNFASPALWLHMYTLRPQMVTTFYQNITTWMMMTIREPTSLSYVSYSRFSIKRYFYLTYKKAADRAHHLRSTLYSPLVMPFSHTANHLVLVGETPEKVW